MRREPLVVRDGCAPERMPAGRWPSDGVLVRSEQFAVNEAIAELDDGGLFAVHAPPGTGVSEVYGDLVAAIVTERARRIAELPDPAAAFGEPLAWGSHVVAAPAPELTGSEIVFAAPERGTGELRQAPGLPPLGARWRDRAARVEYFASTARLSDGVGAWAMLAARFADPPANRGFAERWWHGTMRGTDVLFPAGESMAAALRRLKGTAVYWPACVEWFRSAVGKADRLATERMAVAIALTRLSELEQACEEASCRVESAQAGVADLEAREPAARERAATAEEEYRATLAALGAHELGRPAMTTVTPQGVEALRSRGALSVALAGGVRRGRNWRNWSLARRELRTACEAAEQRWKAALRDAEALRASVTAAHADAEEKLAEVARLAAEMEPHAEAIDAARQRWGDHVPVGPSQAETEDPALIEWRETSAPWADEEYVHARTDAFFAAIELHKALIVARADVFEANLAALMDLISGAIPAVAGRPADGAPAEGAPADGQAADGQAADDQAPDDQSAARLAAWQSFFLVVPVLQMPFEAAGTLLDGLGTEAFGWLLAAGTDQIAADDVPRLMQGFRRAVFAGDTVLAGEVAEAGAAGRAAAVPGAAVEITDVPVLAQATAQHLADGMVRYGTWLPSGSPGPADDMRLRWVGTPLRVVHGQDRVTVDRRNDLAYDGLLITDRD
ncbi:MAG TPA: hypothetical protein VMI73_19395 [Trebonia sp.]|nr:hypothetical protein [Trebonia sp.]